MKVNLLGELVKNIRIKNGWSQESFSSMCGISNRTLQRLESGENASVETVRALANGLKSEFDKLLPFNVVCSMEQYQEIMAKGQAEAERLSKGISILPRIESAKDLASIVSSFHLCHFDHPLPVDKNEASMMGDFLSLVRDYLDIWNDLDPSDQVQAMLELQRYVDTLASQDLYVFGGKLKGSVVFPNTANADKDPLRMKVGAVFVRRSHDTGIFLNSENNGAQSILVRLEPGQEVSLA